MKNNDNQYYIYIRSTKERVPVTKEEFDAFVATCKELSFYDTGFTPVYGDKLICLSTCEYTLENGRLVVAAYRIS